MGAVQEDFQLKSQENNVRNCGARVATLWYAQDLEENKIPQPRKGECEHDIKGRGVRLMCSGIGKDGRHGINKRDAVIYCQCPAERQS